MNPVLQIKNLQVSYYTDSGRATALDGVSLALNAGEKLGLVGESGSGKSTMALAMMRMIKPPGRIEGGQVLVEDDFRRHPAGEADHRLGDDEEQPVDEIVVPPAAGQQGQQALAEERHQCHFNQGAQDGDDEQIEVSHGIVLAFRFEMLQ